MSRLHLRDRAAKVMQSLTMSFNSGDMRRFRKSFARMHPHDRAEYFFHQKSSMRIKLYDYLTAAEVAELFENYKASDSAAYLKEMKTEYAARVLALMHADDAVDVINELPLDQVHRYLALMDDADELRLRQLSQHEEGTAGSIMTTDFVAISERDTAQQAIDKLVAGAEKAVTIYYAFVMDNEGRLTGVVSLRNLLMAKPTMKVHELQNHNVISTHVAAHQEKAAQLIKDYDFLALPVIDEDDFLRGIITVDDAADVMHDAAADDYSKLAAIKDTEISVNPFVNLKKRLPWLAVLLFLGLLTATLISQFEDTIAQVAILGAFIPVVAGTTGNSGTQALAVVVRALATGDLERVSIRRHFLTEALTAIMTSILCGLILLGIIIVWKGQLFIGIVAGVALAISIFVGTLVGSAVPLVMHRVGVDPAVASGPLITTICDILSMFVYFTLATALMASLL